MSKEDTRAEDRCGLPILLVLAVVLFCCLAALADAALRYVTHLLKLED